MQELNMIEIEAVSGGVTQTQALAIGAGVTAVGAAVLFAVASPIVAPAALTYAVVSGSLGLGAALTDAGFGGWLRHAMAN